MASQTGGGSKALFATVIGLVLLGVLLDSEAIGWVIGIVVLLLSLVLMSRVPLRTSLLTLMFFALTLENPAEQFASDMYHTPFKTVGALLLNHLNTTTGVRPLFMSGMDILLGALILIGWSRERSGSKIDRAGRVPTPKPLVRLALISLGGTAFVMVNGMLHGGDFGWALWQVDRVVYLPIIFLLCHWGLRGPADHVALGKVVIAAAAVRATMATIIIHTVYYPKDENGIVSILAYATSHNDSILFAAAFVLLLSLILCRVTGKARRLVWIVMPILILGMISNHRRMVWVQVAMVFLTLYLTTPSNPIKVKVRKILTVVTPIFIVYCLAGWNSGSRLFKPVKIIRSIVDSKSDPSTLWRDIENFDLIETIKAGPIFGQGYGHKYLEVVMLPPVDYTLEFYLPHNSLLGMLSYSGYFGFAAMTMLWVAGAYFAMRAYYATKDPIVRATGLSCFGVVLVYLIQCWGDLGLGAPVGVWLVAPALATAGKAAAAFGGWSDAKKPAAQPSVAQTAQARAPYPR